jgi:hypothetical protein
MSGQNQSFRPRVKRLAQDFPTVKPRSSALFLKCPEALHTGYQVQTRQLLFKSHSLAIAIGGRLPNRRIEILPWGSYSEKDLRKQKLPFGPRDRDVS